MSERGPARLLVQAGLENRLAAIDEWLERRRPVRELLLLAPSRGAGDDFLRRRAARRSPAMGVHRATLGQLAHDLASLALAARDRRPITAIGMVALATRCVHQELSADRLRYFDSVAEMPGFPLAVARTLRELRLEGVEPRSLARGRDANQDLARLATAFAGELERWGLADAADVLEAARRCVEQEAHRLVRLPLVLLDVSPANGSEAALVAALARRAPRCLAVTSSADEAALQRLEEALGRKAQSVESRPPANALERARAYLFSPRTPESREEPLPGEEEDWAGQVELFAAPGEDRECVEIVRRIQRCADRGVAFDRMAILLRHPEGYLPLIESALRRGDVPAWFSRGTSRPDPAGRAFLALLACAGEGASASRFAEYLSLGEIPELDSAGTAPAREVPWVEPSEEQLVFKTMVLRAGEASEQGEAGAGQTLPTPAQWERLLVDAAVIGGRERWQRRLSGLREELRLRLREVEDGDDALRWRLEGQLERLQGLERFALPIIDELTDLPQSASWGTWIELLERLASRVLRSPERVLGLLAEMRPMAQVGPVGLDQVRTVLQERLSFLQREPPARRYGRVFVGAIPEAMGRSFAVVFLPGLAEGVFPRKPCEDPLLLDTDRRELRLPLELQEDRFRRERAQLRLALDVSAERLVASYPRLDQMLGRARVPSFYALDLLRAARGELPDLRRLERATVEASLGWPAPSAPDGAIDDAEFDLAVMAPLLRPGEPPARGKARYLVHCNPHLARSLRTRAGRWHSRWGPSDGVVSEEPETRELLRRHLPENRSYSPTALQTFAACPYRFLLYAVHRLRARDEVASPERLDPLTRGSLFHEIQFVFFGQLRRRGLLPMHPDFEDDLLDIADSALEAVADRYAEELAPAIPRIWRSEVEDLRRDLRGWIRKLLEEESRWTPAHFEFAFGLPLDEGRDPASTAEEAKVLDGRRLRGSIDLVERDWRRRRLRVTDHKTGRAPKDRSVVIGGGETLQPVFYALAAEDALAESDEAVEAGRLFYCTQRGEYAEIEVPLDESSRAVARDVLEAVEESLLDGFLVAAPREAACDYCDYRLICGPYEEIRVARKRGDRLTRLRKLRSQP